ncbi:MAG: formylglycine-generating enzyme family protein [Treponema sp.]
MKFKNIFVFLLVGLLLFSCDSSGRGQKGGAESSVPTEMAKLTLITVGSYSLTNKELEDAQKTGFIKVFDKDFATPSKITAVAEEGATKTFVPSGSESVVLNKTPQTITITVKKIGKLDGVYKLVLSKEDTPEKEKAKLKKLSIGSYSLTEADLNRAFEETGFVKVFDKDFATPSQISYQPEIGATVSLLPDTNPLPLDKTPKTLIVTVKKDGMDDGVYKLVLSKEEDIQPPTPQKLPFDDMVEVNPQESGIVGRTFNATALQWDGVFLKDRVVKLSNFYVAKYELTYKIWHTVTEWAKTHGYTFTGQAKESSKLALANAEPTTDNLPVTQLSWHDAIVWCNAYTEMQKGEAECVYKNGSASGAVLKDATDTKLYEKVFWDKARKGYRLLSEAEWEYVARYQKDNSNNVGREYGTGVWLTKIDTVSGASKNWKDTDKEETAKYCWWTSDVAQQMPKAVDGRSANHLGVHDMSGNMMEWVYDWYKPSEQNTETVENPEGPALNSLAQSDLQKVMKGGAYNSLSLNQCLPAYRNGRRSVLNIGDHMDSGMRLAHYK